MSAGSALERSKRIRVQPSRRLRLTDGRGLESTTTGCHSPLGAGRRGPIVIITDNISTRTGAVARVWLDRHPRVRFVFTPQHGSWLNQIEIWFGILATQALRYGSFNSVRALSGAIYRFTRYWNRVRAKPFEWTYTARVLHARNNRRDL